VIREHSWRDYVVLELQLSLAQPVVLFVQTETTSQRRRNHLHLRRCSHRAPSIRTISCWDSFQSLHADPPTAASTNPPRKHQPPMRPQALPYPNRQFPDPLPRPMSPSACFSIAARQTHPPSPKYPSPKASGAKNSPPLHSRDPSAFLTRLAPAKTLHTPISPGANGATPTWIRTTSEPGAESW
jgi:hypothetical protein